MLIDYELTKAPNTRKLHLLYFVVVSARIIISETDIFIIPYFTRDAHILCFVLCH